MFDKGDDENPKDFKNNLITFSICVCWADMYGSVIGLHIMIYKSKHGVCLCGQNVCLCGQKLGNAWKILPVTAPSLWSW
jgi:hypothetical protein